MTTAFKPGDIVRVAAPFNTDFPDEYVVEGVDDTGTALIAGGRGFADTWLTLVTSATGSVPVLTVPRLISHFAFRQRFTEAERIAIELASQDDPTASSATRQQAAALRVSAADLSAAGSVDLTFPETVAGVQALETAGLIATGRAATILSTTIDPSEAAL